MRMTPFHDARPRSAGSGAKHSHTKSESKQQPSETTAAVCHVLLNCKIGNSGFFSDAKL